MLWNDRFKDRMDYYGVKIRLCRYYRARTKGKVESGVKYLKRNALAGQSFPSIDTLNAYLQHWCLEVADLRIHGTTHEQPRERFLRGEQQAMIVVENRPPAGSGTLQACGNTQWRRVPNDAFVVLDTNRYPVDYTWVGATVAVQIQSDKIVLSHHEQRLEHIRLTGRHQVARWSGVPRAMPGQSPTQPSGPPRFAPNSLQALGDVEVRPLSCYSELCQEVAP